MDTVGKNDEWAAALRAELKKAWDGYRPNPALVTPNDDQGDEPVLDLGQLLKIRESARAGMGAPGTPETLP